MAARRGRQTQTTQTQQLAVLLAVLILQPGRRAVLGGNPLLGPAVAVGAGAKRPVMLTPLGVMEALLETLLVERAASYPRATRVQTATPALSASAAPARAAAVHPQPPQARAAQAALVVAVAVVEAEASPQARLRLVAQGAVGS
jgi:hypothetical protein